MCPKQHRLVLRMRPDRPWCTHRVLLVHHHCPSNSTGGGRVCVCVCVKGGGRIDDGRNEGRKWEKNTWIERNSIAERLERLYSISLSHQLYQKPYSTSTPAAITTSVFLFLHYCLSLPISPPLICLFLSLYNFILLALPTHCQHPPPLPSDPDVTWALQSLRTAGWWCPASEACAVKSIYDAQSIDYLCRHNTGAIK